MVYQCLDRLNKPKEKGEKIPEIVCFDKQEDWGGLMELQLENWF